MNPSLPPAGGRPLPPADQTKRCTKCGTEKAIREFRKDKSKRGGHRTQCSSCVDVNVKEWKEKNREHYLDQKRQYNAANRERQREWFQRWYAANREKRWEQERQRRAADPVKHRQDVKQWSKANPDFIRAARRRRRARQNGVAINDFTAAQWQAMKEHYGHRCVYCGRKQKALTQDHIIPLIQGGNHTASNIVPACKTCNSKKGTGAVLKPIQPLLL